MMILKIKIETLKRFYTSIVIGCSLNQLPSTISHEKCYISDGLMKKLVLTKTHTGHFMGFFFFLV